MAAPEIAPGMMDQLQAGRLWPFSDWPVAAAPSVAAGVYTIWEDGRFIYAGMSGRGFTVEQLERARREGKRKGL